MPDDNVPHIHIPNSVPLVYRIDPHSGKAVDQDSFKSSKTKGNWLLSAENQERLVEKVGVDSESFARSLFSAWDVDGDGYISREELGKLLFIWKKNSNPAINALAGKMLEEVCSFELQEHQSDKKCCRNLRFCYVATAHPFFLSVSLRSQTRCGS